VRSEIPKDTHAAYVRGILFGIGAAILGFALFAGFVIITGISLGYISLAVGFLIGKAMKLGSGGIGGRRYQIAAAALTYAAVSMAAIPIYIHYANKEKSEHASQAPSRPAAPQSDSQAEGGVDNPPLPPPVAPEAQPKMNLWGALGMVALLGLASPFLELKDPFHGLIGLVILFVGIRIAWQLTAGPSLAVIGPFQNNATTSLPSAAT
jgi:hypothetical protein